MLFPEAQEQEPGQNSRQQRAPREVQPDAGEPEGGQGGQQQNREDQGGGDGDEGGLPRPLQGEGMYRVAVGRQQSGQADLPPVASMWMRR